MNPDPTILASAIAELENYPDADARDDRMRLARELRTRWPEAAEMLRVKVPSVREVIAEYLENSKDSDAVRDDLEARLRGAEFPGVSRFLRDLRSALAAEQSAPPVDPDAARDLARIAARVWREVHAGSIDSLHKVAAELDAAVKRFNGDPCVIAGHHMPAPDPRDARIAELEAELAAESAIARKAVNGETYYYKLWKESEEALGMLRGLRDSGSDDFWCWSDTDDNHLESMSGGMLVRMTAGQLRRLLESAPDRAALAELARAVGEWRGRPDYSDGWRTDADRINDYTISDDEPVMRAALAVVDAMKAPAGKSIWFTPADPTLDIPGLGCRSTQADYPVTNVGDVLPGAAAPAPAPDALREAWAKWLLDRAVTPATREQVDHTIRGFDKHYPTTAELLRAVRAIVESAPEPKRDVTAEVLSLVEQSCRVVGDLRAVYGLQGTAIDTAEHTLRCIEIALTTGRVTAPDGPGYDAEAVEALCNAATRATNVARLCGGLGYEMHDLLEKIAKACARVRASKAGG